MSRLTPISLLLTRGSVNFSWRRLQQKAYDVSVQVPWLQSQSKLYSQPHASDNTLD